MAFMARCDTALLTAVLLMIQGLRDVTIVGRAARDTSKDRSASTFSYTVQVQ